MRASLAQQGLPDGRTVASMKDGDHVRYAGLSHRPAASWNRCRRSVHDSGDETGFVNAVIWESVFQRYSVLAKTMSF
jgi:hypothetical protein